MADIKNIDVFQTVTSVTFQVEPNTDIININKVTTSGYPGVPNLQDVTDEGAITTNPITANSFIKSGGTGADVLLDNGTTVALSSIVGVTNLSPSQTATNFTINSNTGTDATIPLGDGTLAGATLNNYTTTEKNKLAGIAIGAEVNVNADWNAISGDAQILNKPNIADYVPYIGATTNVNLGEFGLTAGQVTLDTSPTGIAVVGTTQWNNALGSSETTLKGGTVILKNGVDLVARIVNKVSPNTTLTKAAYQAVRVSGATGQRLSIELAQGDADLNSVDTIGLVTETIAPNQEGFIITMGQIEDINTTGSLQGETWVDGDVLYLSPSTAGRLTNVKPNGLTGHIVVIGYVEYAHINHGKIYVKIMNGWELDELHNVYINAAADKQLLSYDNATSLWKNKSVTTADIAPSTNRNYVTDAQQTVITNTSGTNSGDNATNTQYSGLAASKADKASPTFTGTVVLPSTTSIGNVTDIEIGYLDNVTSAIQTQINSKLTIPIWQDFTSTQVGWSSITTLLVRYMVISKVVVVYFRILGTSNSTTTTITLPFINNGTSNISILGAGINAGNAVIANSSIATGGNILTANYFSTITALSSFTATGTKQIAGTITYEIP